MDLVSPGCVTGDAAVRWAWLGRVDFAVTAALQESLRDRVLAGQAPETILLCEHDPVVTLGRRAHEEHVRASASELAARGVSLHRATRGGDVTYHGPGQLVGYPVLRLPRGLRVHVEHVLLAVQHVLRSLGIEAAWRPDRPGLWVGDSKLCAVGVHVRRGVTIHGFALNVGPDLSGFDLIVPCGLRDAGVTSIARLGVTPPSLAALAEGIAEALGASLTLRLARVPSSTVLAEFAGANPRVIAT